MMAGFPPPSFGSMTGSKEEKRLLALFKSLGAGDKLTLIKFAEFLNDSAQQPSDSAQSVQEQTQLSELSTPNLIERPAQESVIKAIKRLNKSYPMLDKAVLLDKISGLMTEHLIRGRDATSIIDELETVFKSAYEDLLS